MASRESVIGAKTQIPRVRALQRERIDSLLARIREVRGNARRRPRRLGQDHRPRAVRHGDRCHHDLAAHGSARWVRRALRRPPRPRLGAGARSGAGGLADDRRRHPRLRGGRRPPDRGRDRRPPRDPRAAGRGGGRPAHRRRARSCRSRHRHPHDALVRRHPVAAHRRAARDRARRSALSHLGGRTSPQRGVRAAALT